MVIFRAVPSKEAFELPLLVPQLGIVSQEIEVPRNWDTRLYARSVVLQRQVNLDIPFTELMGDDVLPFLKIPKFSFEVNLSMISFPLLSFRELVSQSIVLS